MMTSKLTPPTLTPPPAPGAASDNLTWSVVAAEHRLWLQNQTAVTVARPANWQPKTSGQPATTPRPFALSAAASSQNPKNGTRPATVAPPANSGQSSGDTDSGNEQPRNDTVTPLNRGYVDPPVIGHCEHCGRPLTRKSRNGRFPKFCNDNNDKCRVAAWRAARKAEKTSNENS